MDGAGAPTVCNVFGEFFNVYVANGQMDGNLGWALSNAYQFSSSTYWQVFQGGCIEKVNGGAAFVHSGACL